MDLPEPEARLAEPAPKPWRLTPGRLALHLAIAVAVQAAVLVFLASRNWLDPILPWDDVAFVERAVYHLNALRSAESFSPWFHAPLGDLQTLLGLGLFQLDVRGPYFLNFVYIAAATLFTSYFLRGTALRTRVFATSTVLAFTPLLVATALLKSDQKGGLFLLIAVLLLFEPGRRGLGGAGRIAVIAAAFIIVLAAKMTAIYMPLVALGVIGLRFLVEWFERRSEPSVGGSSSIELSRYVALLALVATGYAALFLPLRHHLIGYIEFALSSKWDAEGVPWKEQVLFYTPFGGTGRYWAGHCVLAAGLAVLAWKKTTLGER